MDTVMIPLTRGLFALADAEDAEMLAQYSWSCSGGRHVHAAARDIHAKGKHVKMHRVVMGAKPGDIVDHINGDPLDNRKANLRLVTAAQNSMNKRARTDSAVTSIYKGVGKRGNVFIARIRVAGKLIEIGRSRCEIEAARMYNDAASYYFGEYARLNVLP